MVPGTSIQSMSRTRSMLTSLSRPTALDVPQVLLLAAGYASHIGKAVGYQGKYDAAEAMHRGALKGREKELGHSQRVEMFYQTCQGWETRLNALQAVRQHRGVLKDTRRAAPTRSESWTWESCTIVGLGDVSAISQRVS
jgi:hypothetical protein